MKDPKCNFMCHEAWTLDAGTPSARAAINPPCDDDDVVFPKDSTYRVLAQGVINVHSLEMNGANIVDKMDVPEYQMTPAGEALKLFIGEDQRNCVEDAAGDCICHSQCATGDRHRDQDQELRDAVKDGADQSLEDMRATEDRAFQALFVIGSIFESMGEDGDGRADMDCIFDDEDARAHVTAQLKAALEQGIPGTRVNQLTVNYLAQSNAIDIRSSNVSVMPASVAERNADGSLGQEWFGKPAVVTEEPMGPNLFNLHLWHMILETASRCEARKLEQKLEELGETCEQRFGEKICGAIHAFVKASADVETNFGGVMAQIDNYIANPPVRTDPDTGVITSLPFVANLQAFASSVRSALQTAALTLLQSRRDGATTQQIMEQAMDFETAQAEVDDAEKEGRDRVPQPTVRRSEETTMMVVGGMLPQSDINRLVDHRNDLPLRTYIAEMLPGTAPIISVVADNTTLTLAASTGTADGAGAGGRDRRDASENDFGTSGQAHTPLAVDLAYVMLVSSDCDAESTGSLLCPLAPGTGPYYAVKAALDDIVTSYDIVTAQCYDLVNGNDMDCAVEQAAKALIAALEKNPELTAQEKQELLRGVLQEVLDCPSGDCSTNADQQAELNDLITEASVEAEKESKKQQSGSSSGSAAGVPMAAVVGAAVGVVLVIVIVVVVVRRRRRPAGKEAAARTVVAFENPMYDEPTKGGAGAPEALYDDAERDDEHDEGLYDEPAFAQGKEMGKENPMYQSTEDILGDDDPADEAGGYLDVAPDEELEDDE